MLSTVIFTALMGLAAALPYQTPSYIFSRDSGSSAVAQLEAIAPSSTSCSGAAYPDECRTAAQAAPFLIDAMAQYGVYSPQEIVALLSLISYETGDFKFNTNHFPAPGRPGQGTRNLQMAAFNLAYALSIPALKSQALAIAPNGISGLSDSQLNAVRALVLPDEYSWASAAWFLTTQCASVRPQIQAGGLAGWSAYLGCVGTDASSDRLAYWTRANAAFGLSA